MRQALEDIKTAWSISEGGGRDEELARELADALVASDPSLFADVQSKSLDELCESIDTLRNAGFEEEVWKIETWLLHRFEPQNIGGVYQPQVRISGETA